MRTEYTLRSIKSAIWGLTMTLSHDGMLNTARRIRLNCLKRSNAGSDASSLADGSVEAGLGQSIHGLGEAERGDRVHGEAAGSRKKTSEDFPAA